MPVSIVAEGGSMRAAYAVGAVNALFSHYGLKRVDVVTGTSGSAPAMAFYAAGSFPSCYNAWRGEVPSPRLLGFSNILHRRPYFDIDYLVDVIVRERAGLDVTALKRSPVRLVLPVTSYRTGHIEYVDFNTSNLNVFDVMRAAMSIPIAYNKTVRLDDDTYFDSHLGDPLCLDNPYIAGTRKIIILTYPLDYVWSRRKRMQTRLFRPLISSVVYRALLASFDKRAEAMRRCHECMQTGDVIIAPVKLEGRPLDNSRQNIDFLIRQGYEDAVQNLHLQGLIGTMRTSPRADFYFPPPTTV
ncbi:patatin-like phospholipase family protein [Candidatus Kaiserbacteria bacterium]|nr:patatin-like phospholipase family protein [Candidatus Kaiserbacteria bacterium]